MKRIFFIFLAFIFMINLYPAKKTGLPDYDVILSKNKIKIGEKTTLLIKVYDIENVRVLWEEMSVSIPNISFIKKLDYYKSKVFCLELIFTVFEGGEYSDLFFEIPILKNEDGSIIYIKTRKLILNVESPLSEKEIETIKNISDPSSIEIKKEKGAADLPFFFSFYLKIILIVLFLAALALLGYHFFYKHIIKGKFGKNIILSPYEKFLFRMEKIHFTENESRASVDKKLSELSEAFKELVYNDFKLNALSETTKELLISLRTFSVNEEIVHKVSALFNDMDLVKFAKAPVSINKLDIFYSSLKDIGSEIHGYKNELDSIAAEAKAKEEAMKK